MAQDIVPIELGLTEGDVVTLWAPRWREDGEEWEAFLGHEDDLYGFPDVAHLVAFIRTAREHDLIDHPAWSLVPELAAAELIPDTDHQFDLVGVPELLAEEPDTWTVGELSDIVAILRALAEVCELDVVREVLDSATGFSMLDQGTLPFSGRDGGRLWTELSTVVAERWDEVLDALDDVMTVPDVPEAAVAAAAEELPEPGEDEEDAALPAKAGAAAKGSAGSEEDADADQDADAEEEPGFWREVGIDPIRLVMESGDYYTLRCYLDDDPVFLGSEGKIDVFDSLADLTAFLVTSAEHHEAGGADAEDDAERNELAEVSTWTEVLDRATAGELEVEVETDNTYHLIGIDEDLAKGPEGIDPNQLELAVELLTDAADWADDDSVHDALQSSESLGWLVSFVLRPDPTRMAPSAPYDEEQKSWSSLLTDFEKRLNKKSRD
ncbi:MULTISPECIES: primosomal protein [Actinoalloteichus]|uniref:Primosomal protein n=1 Tax=Actinoalloteichus fjordicus TaxID=1612552 RepID=A0AAC9LIR4_9PSEU|nr:MULTISPECIES: primosomal protein [Actinoalloteichus]APU17492.1 hypothetical protein UA74_27445 [Actinoalloteichus fjordicus]APU23569.1 hypothetical protein UA75_27990 [Actinoalloteichus sp. GBA129-24]